MPKITLPLIILSLAALSPACLPSGDGDPSGDATPRDTSQARDTATDSPDAPTSTRLPLGSPCEIDRDCERDTVCDAARCARIPCTTEADCGEDLEASNDRGCHNLTGLCTAGECVVAASFNCPEHFDLPGVCDGIICQE